MRPRSRGYFVWLVAGLGAAPGCLEPDPSHCANAGGDAACPATAPFCSRCADGDGCRPVVSPECRADETSAPDTPPIEADATAARPSECGDDGECPAATPFCREGTCAGCESLGRDAFCRDADGHGVCTPWGRCGDCDPFASPTCEAPGAYCRADHSCGGCDEHLQCGDAACDFATGRCLPDDRVWWVDASRCGSAAGFGTIDAPYCTLADALANVAQGGEGTIRLAGGGSPHAETIPALAPSTVVAVIGDDGPVVETDAMPLVEVRPGARVMLAGLELRPAMAGRAVECRDGGVWLDDVVVLGGRAAIDATGCTVVVRHGRIHGALEQGVALHTGSDARIVGSMLTGIATTSSAGAALAATGSRVELVFSSVVGNGGGSAGSLRCDDASSVAIHSSIVAGLSSPSIDCADRTDDYAVLDLAVGEPIGRGSRAAALDPSWFVDLVAGDAHLTSAGAQALAGRAQWRDGDPLWDLDGDPWIGIDLSYTHPGGDRP